MSKFTKVLGTFAPALATAMGGPIAGMATKFIAGALLGNEDASLQEVETAILSGRPDVIAKLRQINADFEAKMRQMDVDLEALAVDDRKSARDLAKVNMWPQITLSFLFIAGYFSMLLVLFGGMVIISDDIRDMANILLGVLTSGIPMILRFWFGGSPQDEAHMERIYNSTPSK